MKFMKNKFLKFTLLEMIVSLAVFLILIAVVLNFYDSIFKISSSSRNNSELFSNARTAMDMITRDLQCLYYKNEVTPFWHVSKKTADNDFLLTQYQNDLLAFISATPLAQTADNISRLCEIKYQLYNTNNLKDDLAGWIMRSVTGDDSSKWNFQYNFNKAETGADNCFTADDESSEPYQKLIPYVTDLSFECFDMQGVPIYSSVDDIDFPIGDETVDSGQMPYSIKVNMTLMDESSWNKYILLTDDSAKKIFKLKYCRTFAKTVFIGEHGQ